MNINAHEDPGFRGSICPRAHWDVLVRASVLHYYNDESEMERFVRAVAS
jgi:selenocysteine lyase/cysteine desulfurase